MLRAKVLVLCGSTRNALFLKRNQGGGWTELATHAKEDDG